MWLPLKKKKGVEVFWLLKVLPLLSEAGIRPGI